MHLYTQMGRLDDAIHTMENAVIFEDTPKFRRQKPSFSVQVVKGLTKAVEEAEDAQTKKRLAVLFNKMDQLADITQVSARLGSF